MQTTLRLDDDLFRVVKAAAARAGVTLTAFVEDALRMRLAASEQAAEAPPDLPVFAGDGLQAGVDLDDTSALLDLMDET